MLCYTTKNGSSYCGDSLSLIPQVLSDNSVDLLFSSPPFPLLVAKEYGNVNQEAYVDWFFKYVEVILPKIKETGSIVLDFGNTWVKGMPCFNLYQFRVLLKMADDYGLYLACPMYWHNPSRLPLPAVYTSIRKIRPKDVIDNVWWLTKNPDMCKSDCTKVLVPYSKSMRKYFKAHKKDKNAWKRYDGALPTNLLEIPNTNNRSLYHRACRSLFLKGQPSIMPEKLCEFFVKMLTNEQDLVVDTFAGSNTTGFIADKQNRRFVSIEQRRDYVAMSAFRFLSDLDHAGEVYHRIAQTDGNLPVDMEQF